MSDCQFPDQCSFPNCFCVGTIDKEVHVMAKGQVKPGPPKDSRKKGRSGPRKRAK